MMSIWPKPASVVKKIGVLQPFLFVCIRVRVCVRVCVLHLCVNIVALFSTAIRFRYSSFSLQQVLVQRGSRRTSLRTSLKCNLYCLLLCDHFAITGMLKVLRGSSICPKLDR